MFAWWLCICSYKLWPPSAYGLNPAWLWIFAGEAVGDSKVIQIATRGLGAARCTPSQVSVSICEKNSSAQAF
jgi:hypothetical protein